MVRLVQEIEVRCDSCGWLGSRGASFAHESLCPGTNDARILARPDVHDVDELPVDPPLDVPLCKQKKSGERLLHIITSPDRTSTALSTARNILASATEQQQQSSSWSESIAIICALSSTTAEVADFLRHFPHRFSLSHPDAHATFGKLVRLRMQQEQQQQQDEQQRFSISELADTLISIIHESREIVYMSSRAATNNTQRKQQLITAASNAAALLFAPRLAGFPSPQVDLSGCVLHDCNLAEADLTTAQFASQEHGCASLFNCDFSWCIIDDNCDEMSPTVQRMLALCSRQTRELRQQRQQRNQQQQPSLQQQQQHTKSVTCIALSPDDTQLATASSDCTAKLWNTVTGECAQTFSGHTGSVTCVVFSPQQQQQQHVIATSSADGTVKLWNTATGECLQDLNGHRLSVRNIAFSPDGKLLASCSLDRTVRLWSSETGELNWTADLRRDNDNSLLISRVSFVVGDGNDDDNDDTMYVCGFGSSNNQRPVVFNAATGERVMNSSVASSASIASPSAELVTVTENDNVRQFVRMPVVGGGSSGWNLTVCRQEQSCVAKQIDSLLQETASGVHLKQRVADSAPAASSSSSAAATTAIGADHPLNTATLRDLLCAFFSLRLLCDETENPPHSYNAIIAHFRPAATIVGEILCSITAGSFDKLLGGGAAARSLYETFCTDDPAVVAEKITEHAGGLFLQWRSQYLQCDSTQLHRRVVPIVNAREETEEQQQQQHNEAESYITMCALGVHDAIYRIQTVVVDTVVEFVGDTADPQERNKFHQLAENLRTAIKNLRVVYISGLSQTGKSHLIDLLHPLPDNRVRGSAHPARRTRLPCAYPTTLGVNALPAEQTTVLLVDSLPVDAGGGNFQDTRKLVVAMLRFQLLHQIAWCAEIELRDVSREGVQRAIAAENVLRHAWATDRSTFLCAIDGGTSSQASFLRLDSGGGGSSASSDNYYLSWMLPTRDERRPLLILYTKADLLIDPDLINDRPLVVPQFYSSFPIDDLLSSFYCLPEYSSMHAPSFSSRSSSSSSGQMFAMLDPPPREVLDLVDHPDFFKYFVGSENLRWFNLVQIQRKLKAFATAQPGGFAGLMLFQDVRKWIWRLFGINGLFNIIAAIQLAGKSPHLINAALHSDDPLRELDHLTLRVNMARRLETELMPLFARTRLESLRCILFFDAGVAFHVLFETFTGQTAAFEKLQREKQQHHQQAQLDEQIALCGIQDPLRVAELLPQGYREPLDLCDLLRNHRALGALLPNSLDRIITGASAATATRLAEQQQQRQQQRRQQTLTTNEIFAVVLYTFDTGISNKAEQFYFQFNDWLLQHHRSDPNRRAVALPMTHFCHCFSLALSKLPAPDATDVFYRGISVHSEAAMDQFVREYRPDSTVVWSAFTSLSRDRRTAEEFILNALRSDADYVGGVIFAVRGLVLARDVSQFSYVQSEREVVLPPGARLLVDDQRPTVSQVTMQTGRGVPVLTIQMRQLNPAANVVVR